MEDLRKKVFADIKRLVVKVGTRLLCNDDNTPNTVYLKHLVSEICRLQDGGHALVLVSSGAVGLGMGALGYKVRPSRLPEKQACAAVGQVRLMHLYEDLFAKRGKVVAQILLSAEDFHNRTRFNNIRNTVDSLLAKGVIPIINENDTITTDEIKVGDNDKLSADVAHFLDADLLVILSDEDGLYTRNPKQHPDAQPIAIVPKVTPEILKLGGAAPGSGVSVGGMRAKLRALQQATEAGTPAVLTKGTDALLLELVRGKTVGTLFLPNSARIRNNKRWMAFVSKPKGQIGVDAGGEKALLTRKVSLLPAGILKIKGNFVAGDFVEILNPNREVIGRGRTAYSASDVEKIRGKKSGLIPEILGRKGPEEVIHRDQLVIF